MKSGLSSLAGAPPLKEPESKCNSSNPFSVLREIIICAPII